MLLRIVGMMCAILTGAACAATPATKSVFQPEYAKIYVHYSFDGPDPARNLGDSIKYASATIQSDEPLFVMNAWSVFHGRELIGADGSAQNTVSQGIEMVAEFSNEAGDKVTIVLSGKAVCLDNRKACQPVEDASVLVQRLFERPKVEVQSNHR